MAAHELCPGDAVTCHELGVCAYKAGNVSQAMSWLHMALQLASAVQVCVQNRVWLHPLPPGVHT